MVAGELERILALPPQAWQSGTDPAVRASHFTPTTLWMLGAIENSSEHPIERWLVLQSRRRWDVRLFAVDAKTGAVVAQYASGQQVLIEERGLSIPEASFTVNLSPAQRLLLVLRLQDKTFGPVVATLYDPETRERQTARMHEALVALLGFILAIVLVLLVQGDWRYMIVAIWLAGTAIYEFVYLVPLQPRLFPALTPYFVPILTVSGSLAMAAWSARSIRKRPYGNLLMALFGFYWIVVLVSPLIWSANSPSARPPSGSARLSSNAWRTPDWPQRWRSRPARCAKPAAVTRPIARRSRTSSPPPAMSCAHPCMTSSATRSCYCAKPLRRSASVSP